MSDTASPLGKRRFEAGEIIFMEGDPGTETYLIQSGRVGLMKRGADGLFEPLATLGPGQVFGEMALATNRPRAAGARALEDCQVISVSRAHIDTKLKDADPFIAALFRILAGNLEATLDRKREIERAGRPRTDASRKGRQETLDRAMDDLTDA